MKNILIIGYGKIGSCFIDPINELFNVTVVSPNSKPSFECQYFNDLSKVTIIQDYIVFAVKPYLINSVINKLKENKCIFNKNTHFISLMAGIKIEYFIENLYKDIIISLLMVNIPIKYKKGILGLLSDHELDFIKELGTVIKWKNIDEFHKFTALFGSGSGFVYKILEEYKNLIKENFNLENDISEKLTLKLFDGSFENIKEEKKTFENLINDVQSPNGTTMAGLNKLEDIKVVFRETIDAAKNKSKELSN